MFGVCVKESKEMMKEDVPLDGCPSGPADVVGEWPCSSPQPPAHLGARHWTPTTADPGRSPDYGSTDKH